jgi:hypothetical protein
MSPIQNNNSALFNNTNDSTLLGKCFLKIGIPVPADKARNIVDRLLRKLGQLGETRSLTADHDFEPSFKRVPALTALHQRRLGHCFPSCSAAQLRDTTAVI